MTTQTLGILIAGALFVHGVGHTLGFFRPAQSRILSALGKPVLRVTANILWTLALAGFIGAGLSFLGLVIPVEWWRPLTVVSALVSLSGLVLFLGDWPVFNTIGAVGFNLAALAVLVWL